MKIITLTFLLSLFAMKSDRFGKELIETKKFDKMVSKTFKTEKANSIFLEKLSSETHSFFQYQENDKTIGYGMVGRVDCCRMNGCDSPANSLDDIKEYLDYVILYNPEGTIQEIRVLKYNATRGYEVTSRGWLKQFFGLNGKQYKKTNFKPDAISGATISVNAITADIKRQTSALYNYLKR